MARESKVPWRNIAMILIVSLLNKNVGKLALGM